MRSLWDFSADPTSPWSTQTTPTQRYLYNGKELYEQLGLGWYDYGARWYDAAVGRFPCIDPLAERFAWVSPYNYAENEPVGHVDLWGLQAFSIHGTTETRDRFTNSAMEELVRIAGNSVVDRSFQWDAGITNNPASRQQAAKDLVAHIKSVRQKMLDAGIITSDEHISLIGYSHGGNVAIQAAKILAEEGVEVNLITVSTPAATNRGLAQMEQEYQAIFPIGGSALAPANFDDYRLEIPGAGINEHLQIVHENDRVVNIAGGGRGATFEAPATNLKVPNTSVPINSFPSSIKSHIDLPNHPKFSDYLKTIPTMSKPKRK